MGARITVLYFASLRDAAGIGSEQRVTRAADLRGLYEEVRSAHSLPFPLRQLRVAVNGEFARWDDAPGEGDEIAFIPPVSGG